VKNLILQILTIFKMAMIKQRLWNPLLQKTYNPKKNQNELLLQILKKNKSTRFGRDHHFETISSYEDYQEAVPVTQYEQLRHYIEKQEADKTPHLNLDQPVMYAQTSGSTGKPKYIPLLKHTITQYRKSQHIVACSIYYAIPGTYKGKILAIVSPATEGIMETGAPYGAMSGLIYNSMPKLMRSRYVLPAQIFEIKNYDEKYYQITLHAIAEKNITMIATANPSTLVKLEQVMNQNTNQLIDDISQIDSQRADELKKIILDKGSLSFSDLWPNLKALVTWTGGSCGVQIPQLKKKLPSTTRIVEMGYLASEFRGGITIDPIENIQIPALHETFFEFVEKEHWESGKQNFKTLDQIETDKQYYIFATTQNGLYRYDINDLIKVTGRFNNTPTIQFIQKGKGVTNLTGEKLYESQLIQGMINAQNKLGIEIQFFIMLGCADDLEYTLYIEHADIEKFNIEQQISQLNIEFETKRQSGRLKPIKVEYVKRGTGDIYKRHCIENGQREGQFKLNYLQYEQDCSFDFREHLRVK
jgi:GH3 auxin-responsive promoter